MDRLAARQFGGQSWSASERPTIREFGIFRQPCAIRGDLCGIMHVSLSEVPGILAENVKTTMVFTHVLNRSPLDSPRKAVSSGSGRIIRTGRPA